MSTGYLDIHRSLYPSAASAVAFHFIRGTIDVRTRPRFLPVIVIALISCFALPRTKAQTSAAAPRAITVDDIFALRDVRDPQITADGKWVAYTVSTMSLKEDKSETRIWMVPGTGGDPIVMTAPKVSSSHPRWSPDGKYLAFLSKRGEGKTQVWLLNRLGGEAEQLTETIQDVDDFAWSPDSKRMVLVLQDPSPEELQEAKEKEKEKPGSKPGEEEAKSGKPKTPRPHVIDRYRFKTDTIGYLDRRRTHLYIFDIATKALTQITSGDFDDEDPAWSPDGKLLAFSSNRSLPDPDRTYNSDIWVVGADNTDKGAHLTQITTNPGEDNEPSWSPDGKWITYLTKLDPKLFQYGTLHVAISPAGGGPAKVLTKSFDRMSRRPKFSPDGQDIYFTADDDGTENLCRIPVAGGEITRPISGHVVVGDYSISKSGELAAQVASAERPNEVFALSGSGTPMRITHVNDEFLGKLKLVTPEYVKFKSKDGTMVAGYLYKPLDYQPGQKYPTLLHPHGGPVGAYHGEFNHFSQLFAANGYVVLEPNPRGSSGYGEPFCKAIYADWGNKDFQDDMAMVDYAVAKGIADPDKLGVGGWSYGAISTDFIIAQTTRFKAAISGAGSAFFAALYGHDEYVLDYDTELGQPWANRAVWDKISFFYKVDKITTPTLFMGGDIDWNVPIVGSEEMYEAMKSLGRETELVVYPGEYHGFKTP
ncbi:MAG TPA: S9 family peptidase, partial [Terriglobales bacterium]